MWLFRQAFFISLLDIQVILLIPKNVQTPENLLCTKNKVGHVISRLRRKDTFDFSKIINKYGLRRGIVCQMVRFILHFSLKLDIQF